MAHTAVLVGAGGFAGVWAAAILPQLRDELEVVGIADPMREALVRSANALGILDERRFANAGDMLDGVDADICIIVIQPQFRPEIVRQAAAKGMAILTEKPAANTWSEALEYVQLVRDNGIRYAVIQNYRETTRIHALKRVLDDGTIGRVNLLSCRMAVNYTIETAGGAFRHQRPDAFIVEGAEHHLDQFRNLLGCEADWIQGAQWNQPWSTFSNNPCLLLTIRMTNGAMVQFEMNHIERGEQSGWHEEWYRVSGEFGAVTLDQHHVLTVVKEGQVVRSEVPAAEPNEGHLAQIRAFIRWLDGGRPPNNALPANLGSMAMVAAAIDATHSGHRTDVGRYLAEI